MAEAQSQVDIEFDKEELTIAEAIKVHSFPIIVKTCTYATNHRIRNQHGMPDNKEMVLQQMMCVKFASVKVLTSLNTEKAQDKDKDVSSSDKLYLIPVKYHGKVKFVHRPGRRRRYAAVSQVLQDLPRYISVGEDTSAQTCSGTLENVIVEQDTTLEIVRKVTRPENKTTYLECTNGSTVIAFSEQDRLNCTAVDDTKLYNFFELVRSKLLPRVVQFEAVDPNDIIHVDNALYCEAVSVVDQPVELQGFTDVEVIVGCVRNETSQTFETVLIPKNIWTALYVHAECADSKMNNISYLASCYGPFENVDFIEKALYLLPLEQSDVMWLTGPAFKTNLCSTNTTRLENQYTDIDEFMPQVPVIQLPQVKKKKTLFKKVHTELLRLFKSSDSGKQSRKVKNMPVSPEKTASKKKQKRYTRTANNRVRSVSMREFRSEPGNLKYTRRNYGDTSSYLEFYDEDDSPPLSMRSEHLRLSMSLGDIPKALFSCSTDARHSGSCSPNLINPPLYSEIRRIPKTEDQTCIGSAQNERSYITAYSHDSTVETIDCATNTSSYVDMNRYTLNTAPYVDMNNYTANTVLCVDVNKYTLNTAQYVDMNKYTADTASYIDMNKYTANTPPYVDMRNYPANITSTQNMRVGDKPEKNVTYDMQTMGHAQEVFYQYTVVETYECFKQCGLGDFALKCRKHKLNGSFFRNFDYENLRDDPFYLSKFNILKLRKIIEEGWRPT